MGFVLNLLSFLLIVFGLLFTTVTSPNNKELIFNNFDKSKLTKEQSDKIESLLSKIRFASLSAVILGVGIIVARIFS